MNSERLERLKLAWAILWGKDTPLVCHVRSEIGRIDSDVVLNCTNVARVFDLEGHSGGSASIVIPWIERALSWQPIAPLTGDADEWCDVSEASGRTLWQNKRCGSVFKESDGLCYDISGIVYEEPNGCRYSKSDRVPVTFPYTPTTTVVKVPA